MIAGKAGNDGIIRNYNGFPAYCFYKKDTCIHPLCISCSSWVAPDLKPLNTHKADKELYEFLDADPNAVKLLGDGTKEWYKRHKSVMSRLARRYGCEVPEVVA